MRRYIVTKSKILLIKIYRAVYANADVYLLDDPLSGVDSKVGSHIFKECIRGLLKSKLIVFVTHQTQYCNQASQILILKNGEAEFVGSYEQLVSKCKDMKDSDICSSLDFDELEDINASVSKKIEVTVPESRSLDSLESA